jgi:hypothetical protein
MHPVLEENEANASTVFVCVFLSARLKHGQHCSLVSLAH